MAPEILPGTSDGREVEATITDTREDSSLTRVISGTTADIRTVARGMWTGSSDYAFTDLPGRVYELVSTEETSRKGRGSVSIVYRMKAVDGSDGLQELYGIDLIRDIFASPYFATLTNDQVIAVRDAYEKRESIDAGWTQLQKRLYGHMNHGQESYTETHYELRLTWNTTSARNLQVSASDPNTVQSLPALKPALQQLVNGLPAGEWLKKPAQVVSSGRQGWTVRLAYEWATAWSVIYGGSFTGED